jgi:anti-sigma factor RsiW
MSDAHAFADKDDAAERYLLGQMTEADRDAYEQHFFQCVECADEVKATARFLDSCRIVLADREGAARAVPRPAQRIWFPRRTSAVLTGALAATLAIMVYQNAVTIPRLTRAMAPRALTAVSLASSSRGAGAPTIAAPRQQPFLIFVDIPPAGSDTYDCTIVAKDGDTVIPVSIAAAQTQDAVPLLIPSGLLAPGDYTLVVKGRRAGAGESATEVARFPFTLRFVD